MSISSVSNSASLTDNRSAIQQSGTKPASQGSVDSGRADSQGSQTQTSGVDAVSISSRANDLKSLENSIRALPDTDSSRVNAIRLQIESGQYVVDSQRVADRILAFERNI